MTNMMPNARPCIGQEEISAVVEVLKSGWLGFGPNARKFESALCEFIGGDYTIAVNSGTSALQLALEGFSIGPGDEVVVPSFTFCASVQAIIAAGATPVFADIDPKTLCINPSDVYCRITNKTKAIMPVHYGGYPCDMDTLLKMADESKLVVIEDAAHAFGSAYKGRLIGSFGHATCFSFDPIKNITCGEGGAVIVHDQYVAEKIRTMRLLGISVDGYERYKKQIEGYQVIDKGYRFHMSDINAAIGLQQLSKFDRIAERRREISNCYRTLLSTVKEISVMDYSLQEIVPFNFVIRVHQKYRDKLLLYLRENGVGVGIHYPPNHLQPKFSEFSQVLPVTESIFQEIITLPLYTDMEDSDIYTVVQLIRLGLKTIKF